MNINGAITSLSVPRGYPQRHYKKEVKPMEEELFKEYPDIVGVGDLRKMLKIGRSLAYRLVYTGEIESRKIGREYKITKNEVIRYINKKED